MILSGQCCQSQALMLTLAVQCALESFRQRLKQINSPAEYNRFLHPGFRVILRDEGRSIEETPALAEQAFGLQK